MPSGRASRQFRDLCSGIASVPSHIGLQRTLEPLAGSGIAKTRRASVNHPAGAVDGWRVSAEDKSAKRRIQAYP